MPERTPANGADSAGTGKARIQRHETLIQETWPQRPMAGIFTIGLFFSDIFNEYAVLNYKITSLVSTKKS